jgi:pimeloyl-ACP methyl ester carboxylesterase
LQFYRVYTSGRFNSELEVYAGRTIDVPSMFIAGTSDWGIYQAPGALERMQQTACTDLRGIHLIEGAGHWVQQEKPDAVNKLLLDFLAST